MATDDTPDRRLLIVATVIGMLTIAVVLLPIVLLDEFTGIAVASIFVGPMVAAVAVGLTLRDADLIAAVAFLGGGTIAVIGGSAAAGAGVGAAAGVTFVAGGIGVGIAASRLERPPSSA